MQPPHVTRRPSRPRHATAERKRDAAAPPPPGAVATFTRGPWSAHVIDRNHPYHNHGVPDHARYVVLLAHPEQPPRCPVLYTADPLSIGEYGRSPAARDAATSAWSHALQLAPWQ